jgi:hypothetical protein
MAKAVSARKQGDEYQALFFWKQLIRLLTEDVVKTVTFESYEHKYIDDVYVEYYEPILDDQTGAEIQIDAFQCKYHVAQSALFSIDKLIDPEFNNSKHSMLERLYEAFVKLSGGQKSQFRLHIVSSSTWDSSEAFCNFLSPEGYIRAQFFEKGKTSIQGKIRIKLVSHLQIAEDKLRPFLESVRFDLGLNRIRIVENLVANFKSAGLISINKTISDTKYAGLPWKWLEQGRNTFDKKDLLDIAGREKLIDLKQSRLLLIRHQSFNPIVSGALRHDLPNELSVLANQEIVINQSDLFRDGKMINPMLAAQRQQKQAEEIKTLCEIVPRIELGYFGIAHIPLVFLAGYQINPRKPIHLFEHNRKDDRWNLLQMEAKYPELILQGLPLQHNQAVGDVVVKFSISYSVLDDDVLKVVPSSLALIEIGLASPRVDNIRNLEQLELYVSAFRNVLDEIHDKLPNARSIQVFYAGPVTLAFRCGQMISPTIHPRVLVYNYFYQDVPRYKWGICVNTSVDSPDFLVQL